MKTNELKCTDLRIGNYVSYYNIWHEIVRHKIVGIEKDRVLIEYNNGETDYYDIDYIEPIELTEEVLEKIVGVKVVDLDYNKTRLIGTNYHFNDCMVSLIYKGDKYHTQLISSRYRVSLDVKHLHQLQNAYYCLTNQEMEIEL